MGDVFSYRLLPVIFNMTVTAGVVILAVLLVRFLLKKLRAPAAVSYALWAVVLFRLLCPVSVTAPVSLLGALDVPAVTTQSGATTIEYVPREIVHMENPAVELPIPVVDDAINAALPQGEEQLRADPLEGPVFLLTMLWLCGIVALVVYGIVPYVSLRRRLVGAVPLEENVHLADHISSPFVMGLLRPKIYLPSDLPESEREYILLHEKTHIRRLDHVVKILAFAALCIHWFNPLVWLAFYLSGQDMEMSCDEAVVRKLGGSVRADYSASLLKLSTGRTVIAATPLAFGEGNTKGRIKNLAKWKKPAVWITVVAVILCAAAIVLCATNAKPPADHTDVPQQTEQPEPPPRVYGPDMIFVPERCVYLNPMLSYYPAGADNGYLYRMGDRGVHQVSRSTGDVTVLAEGADWEQWEDFPWSAREWKNLFWASGMDAVNIRAYDEKLYCPLSNEDFCLLRMDKAIWVVGFLQGDNGERRINSIYELALQNNKGGAQWEYSPILSSRDPFFRFELDVGGGEISASCTAGKLDAPERQTLKWYPMEDGGTVALESAVYFMVTRDEQNFWGGTIYLKGSIVKETGKIIWTATVVGTDLVMEQNPDGGAVIRLK